MRTHTMRSFAVFALIFALAAATPIGGRRPKRAGQEAGGRARSGPGAAARPDGPSHRPRPHRPELALALGRDGLRHRPLHLQGDPGPDGQDARADLRPEPGGDLRGDRKGPARALRRDRPQDQGRDLGPGRRHVGRARRQHARRRGARPPAPLRQALLPGQVRHRRQGRLEPRHVRPQLADAADPAPGRDRLLRLRPLRARAGPDPFLLVGGDGRLARPRLRAGRLVQRQPPGRDAQDPGGRAQEHGHQGLHDPLRRRGPRRRAARRGPRRDQEIPGRPERASARLRSPGDLSQGDRRRERSGAPGRQARAQLHLPGLLHDPDGDQEEQPPAREPARHGREVLRDRRGLGLPGLLSRARHRRGLEDRPPQPVPRHPRRLVASAPSTTRSPGSTGRRGRAASGRSTSRSRRSRTRSTRAARASRSSSTTRSSGSGRSRRSPTSSSRRTRRPPSPGAARCA